MSSYLVTGVSRGVGFEFLQQLSENPENTVFGLVRDKATTDKKVETQLKRKNIHIIQADVTDYDALTKAVDYVSKATGGSLDYIIANHALLAGISMMLSTFGELSAKDPAALEQDLLDNFKVNTIGVISVFNLFVPLLLKGQAKKAIAISTGMADIDQTVALELDTQGSYTISKVAVNMAVAKFHAEYAQHGVLFMSISPGVVETGGFVPKSEEEGLKLQRLMDKMLKFAPDFKGPISTEESVKAVMSVIEKSSIEAGNGGSFVSHHGNKQWI